MANQLNPTPINPRGFTNTNNIQGVYGDSVPNTFTRSVGQADNGAYARPMVDAGMQNQMVSDPLVPPVGVQTPTVPIYDINNQ
jgi:hypothetical protein